MMTRTKNIITAISVMAVMFIMIGLNGCVTPRHMAEVKAEVREVKAQNETTRRQLTHMDSVISQGAESNAKLRNDVSITVDQLQQQIASLLVNYNDMMALLQRIASEKKIILSSPGVQSPVVRDQTTTEPTAPAEDTPSIDCSAAYDDAFILVRRGEYDQAIDGFNVFLKECPKHENAENAYYWIGECYYLMDKYHEAISQFDLLLKEFKSSPNIGRALYKLGRSYQELGRKAEAKQTYQRVLDEFAGTLEAEQARERLKEL
ncbi:MAG: tol-pal system protein YbgF [candidate division Zixibacteria bacterium]|nr:tol-pal system protein YbgF [candidate division Zixibacteria bacterium]